MWTAIEKRCREKYDLQRTKESLRCKRKTLSHDVQIWIACLRRIRTKQKTGGGSDDEERRIAQELYQIKSKTRIGTSPKFKFFQTAKFLGSYPKF